MELALQNGDYLSDGAGGLRRVEGREALLQRVLYRLTARRGQFPLLPELGSELWKLGQRSPSERQAAAEQAVVQALEEEPLTVKTVTLRAGGEGILEVITELLWNGETLHVGVEVR